MRTSSRTRSFLLALACGALAPALVQAQCSTASNSILSTHYLGSSNNIGLQFKVNNANRMYIAPAAPNTMFAGIGPFSSVALPQAMLHVHSAINDANNIPFATFQLTNAVSTAAANRGLIATLANTGATLVNREGRMAVTGATGVQLGGTVNGAHLVIPASGNVGIGTTNPLQRLHVRGGFQLLDGANAALCFGSTATGQYGEYLIEYDTSTDPNSTVDGLNFAKPGGSQGGSGFQNFVLYLNDHGNIGMGVTPSHIDNAFKLSVNGTIRANEIVVETGWADHVFAADYRLMPLAEVAAFIRAEGHLPGVPDAAEVQACGASLGETQTMLLAKVEELTLYILEQERRIAELEQRAAATTVPVAPR